jgi:hypothetical protein
MTSRPPFVSADIINSLHAALDAFAARVANLGVLDWILLALVLALLAWGWVRARALATLGSLAMDDIKCDGSDFTPAGAKALLQQELSHRGLLPPSGVPGGAPTVASIADAISNAPIDQAKWVGALIKLIPLPPASTGFTVGGTLLSTTVDGRKQVQFAYQLICTGPGQSVVLDVATGGDESRAIRNAATEIYRKVAKAAPAMYPSWAQWRSVGALDAYRQGLELESGAAQRRGGHGPGPNTFQAQHAPYDKYAAAYRRYVAASGHDPDNMLVRLRAANCLERMASGAQDPTKLKRRTEALAAYVSIRVRQPDIFEAGFRASVLMSILSSCDAGKLEANELLQVTLDRLERADPKLHDTPPAATAAKTPTRRRLELAARAQNRRAVRRLWPLWTVVHEGRFPHLFEPTGRERRQLRKALRISLLAQRARREQRYDVGAARLRSEAAQVLWRAAVTLGMVGRASASGWQANYNAACFYALLPQAERTTDASSGPRLRRLALEYLRRAITLADGQLPCAYVRDEDADLATLRRLNPEGFAWTIGPLCADEVTIHYRRPNSHGRWVLHVWGTATLPSEGQPWNRPLRPVRHTRDEAVFRVRIFDENGELHFLAHKGDRKDDPGWKVIPTRLASSAIWVNPGGPAVYISLEQARGDDADQTDDSEAEESAA